MNAARIEDSRATEVSRAGILHTSVNIYSQHRIQRFLQKRYLKIDFLTLYKINLLAACGKVKRKLKIGKLSKQAGAELCQAQDQLGLPAEAKLILEVVYNLGCAAEDI